jgi:glycosyltransferase involved in cell wall biosynthesis
VGKTDDQATMVEVNVPDLLNILQVNGTDIGGGAAGIARALHHAYRTIGHRSWLVVGHKLSNDPHTLPIRHDLASSWWQRPFWRGENKVTRSRNQAFRRLRHALLLATDPRRVADWYHGYEDFHYPGTARLLDLRESAIDILHFHNLHGRYFDLRQLPPLTAMVPSLLSLHDTWLFSGHCSYSLDCERWREGCGNCPDLSLYPAILRDATAENWQRKQEIYAQSRYHVISPCQWLVDRVVDSPLQAGLLSARVIPHGIDLSRFRPGDRSAARRELGLPETEQIVLMVANNMRHNPWKGFRTAKRAFARLSAQKRQMPLLVLVIGDSAAEEKLEGLTIRYIPYERDQTTMARYYQAADLFLSTSRAEVWGLAITEAMACGLSVVATAVGGTPEQINSWPHAAADIANGILVPSGDSAAMAAAVTRLLEDKVLRQALGGNALQRARAEFDFDVQVERYLAYYREIIDAQKSG